MNRLLIVPALMSLLGGCVIGGENARHDMEASKVAYKACLAAHGPEACEAQQQAYAADLAAYRATPKIVIGGGHPSPMPNMQPRLLIPATGGMPHMMVPMGGGNFMVMP